MLVDGIIKPLSENELVNYQDRLQTIAAHKDGDNFTLEELEKIEEYKKLLIAARQKGWLFDLRGFANSI